MFSWEDAQTLLAVSEYGSFSGAAKHLDVGQPTISRRIQNLEKLLKQQLFIRGKQGAKPTEAAAKLMPAAEQMAIWAVEFDRLAMGADLGLSGVVRIAAPPGIAVSDLAPFSARLKILEPLITLEVLASVDYVDLTRGAADLAIRIQKPTEPELVALYQRISRPGVFATREYVSQLTQPCRWQDLDWITWAKPYQNVAPRPMLEKLIPNFKPVFASDDYLVQKAAVMEGLGAMVMGAPAMDSHERERLVEIDLGTVLPESVFYVVCAKSMQQVARVQRLMKHLEDYFSTGEEIKP